MSRVSWTSTAVASALFVIVGVALTACVDAPLPAGSSHPASAVMPTETLPPTTTAPPQSAPTPMDTPTVPATPFTPQPEPTPSGLEPVIVIAGIDVGGESVSVSGYVAGVSEQGGSCTFTLANGSATVSRQGTGITDVRTTSCGLVQIPIGEFTSGSWNATLAYSALDGESVISQPTTVVIP